MASSPASHAQPRPDSISIHAETHGPVSPRTVSRLLLQPTTAFEEFAAEVPEIDQPVTLSVSRLSISSVDLTLVPQLLSDGAEVVSSFATLYGANKVLAGFMTHLSEILGKITQGVDLFNASRLSRLFIADAARLVSDNHVVNITINNTQSNATIVIDGKLAREIITGLRSQSDAPRTLEAGLSDGLTLSETPSSKPIRDNRGDMIDPDSGEARAGGDAGPAEEGILNNPFGSATFGSGGSGRARTIDGARPAGGSDHGENGFRGESTGENQDLTRWPTQMEFDQAGLNTEGELMALAGGHPAELGSRFGPRQTLIDLIDNDPSNVRVIRPTKHSRFPVLRPWRPGLQVPAELSVTAAAFKLRDGWYATLPDQKDSAHLPVVGASDELDPGPEERRVEGEILFDESQGPVGFHVTQVLF